MLPPDDGFHLYKTVRSRKSSFHLTPSTTGQDVPLWNAIISDNVAVVSHGCFCAVAYSPLKYGVHSGHRIRPHM